MIDYTFTSLKKVELSPLVRKVWVITSIIVFLLLSLLFLPWQQTVKGEGTIIAHNPTERDYSIVATLNGFLDEVYVHENQFVSKGTKLFKMVDVDKEYLTKLKSIQTTLQEQSSNILEQIENINSKKENFQKYIQTALEVYTQNYEQTKKQIEGLELKKIALEKNFKINQANYERTNLLYNEGIESKRSFESAENSYVKAKAEFEKIDIDIDIENGKLAILDNEKKKFHNESANKLKVLENALLISQNSLHSINQNIQKNLTDIARLDSGDVVAQKDGYVVRILQNDQHKYIKKGEQIILFSPKVTTKSLLLKISDFNMPLMKEGLPVRIRFYGWPALQIPGWPMIKYGTFAGDIHKVENSSHERGFYYAYILEDPKEPWPSGDALRVGTQATAWVRLDTVPIWYQLWRLMNALPPKMVTPLLEKKK